MLALLGFALLAAVGALLATRVGRQAGERDPLRQAPPGRFDASNFSLSGDGEKKAVLWWNDVPKGVQRASRPHNGISNIRPADYAGAESCKPCHEAKYRDWLGHSHRLMNALATPEHVVGDFSDTASIRYRGAQARFSRQGERYFMRLQRADTLRVFQVNRTIGSRFYQYYVGQLVEGPEAPGHPIRAVDHVLPIGWWIAERQWVPVVHVSEEPPDALRDDPMDVAKYEYYDRACATCHVTYAQGDWLLRPEALRRVVIHGPRKLGYFVSGYLNEAHRDVVDRTTLFQPVDVAVIAREGAKVVDTPAVVGAPSLGIACEACHGGARFHAEDPGRKPLFFPSSPYLYTQARSDQEAWGHTPVNVNWTCARCHSGGRPRYAFGMATWNSTEFSDASRGHCYDAAQAQRQGQDVLTCVHCHDPHQGIGPKWKPTADNDDRRCLECHAQFEPESARLAHTRHPLGSPGSRCMECHMPRINEGIQDVVRTHTIFSPTEPSMLEAGHPNACNLCHLDRPIEWTMQHLRDWYGAEFDPAAVARAYSDPQLPVGAVWLASENEHVRLVAADALARAQARWALPDLLESLDDPYLLNRQFAQKALESWLGLDLEDHGYRFWMTPQERAEPLARVKTTLSQDVGGAETRPSNGGDPQMLPLSEEGDAGGR